MIPLNPNSSQETLLYQYHIPQIPNPKSKPTLQVSHSHTIQYHHSHTIIIRVRVRVPSQLTETQFHLLPQFPKRIITSREMEGALRYSAASRQLSTKRIYIDARKTVSLSLSRFGTAAMRQGGEDVNERICLSVWSFRFDDDDDAGYDTAGRFTVT